MIKDCLSIASFFQQGQVTQDEIPGANFMSLVVDSSAAVLLRKIGSSWEYVSGQSAALTTLRSWATSNNLNVPSVSQLGARISYSGNVYLTAGELCKILVYMGLYGTPTIDANASGADARVDANNVSARYKVSQYNVPDRSALTKINLVRNRGIYPMTHYFVGNSELRGDALHIGWHAAAGGSTYDYANDGDYSVDGYNPSVIMCRGWQSRYGVGYPAATDGFAAGTFRNLASEDAIPILYVRYANGATQNILTSKDFPSGYSVIIGMGISVMPANTEQSISWAAGRFDVRVKVVYGLANNPSMTTTEIRELTRTVTLEPENDMTWISDFMVYRCTGLRTNTGGVVLLNGYDFASLSGGYWYDYNGYAVDDVAADPQLFPRYGSFDASGEMFNIFAPVAYSNDNVDYDTTAPVSNFSSLGSATGLKNIELVAQSDAFLSALVLKEAYVLDSIEAVQAYAHVGAVNWESDSQSYMMPNLAQYEGGDVRLTFVTDRWKVTNDSLDAGAYAVRTRCQAVVNSIGNLVSVGDYYSVSSGTNQLFIAALNAVDVFQGDNIIDTPINQQLRDIIGSVYSTMDAYMAMYADYTANIVVAEVLDSLQASLTTGLPMATTYGVTDDARDANGDPAFKVSYADGSVRMFNAKTLREAGDTADTRYIVESVASTSKNLNYSIMLFMEMHDAFQNTDSLSNFTEKIAKKVEKAKQNAITVATLNSGVSNKALFLNCCETESMYSRIMAALSSAISAGQSTMSDAVNYITKVAPELGYYLTEVDEKSLYEQVLAQSSYASYKANILNTPYALKDSDVSYWGTYINRVGSSILNNPSPDAEFQVMSDGAMYVYPPIITMRLTSDAVGQAMANTSGYFTVPFKYSYAMVHDVFGDGKTYEFNWCARFDGGNDADLVNAFTKSWDEFFTTTGRLAKAYTGDDVDFRVEYPELPDGFVDQYVNNQVVGALAVIGTAALSSVLSTDWAGTKNMAGQYGARYAIGATLPSIAIGATIGGVVAAAGTIWSDDNGKVNSNYSAQSVVSATNQPSFIDQVRVSNYPALEATGYDAVKNLFSVFAWALRHGLISPVGDYDAGTAGGNAVGIGVLSPSLIAPKFVYVGERTDYSALLITAGVALTAAYTRRYLRYEKVRTVSYLPYTAALAAGSVAGDILSEVTSEEAASESDLNELAEAVEAMDDEVDFNLMNETVKSIAMLLGVQFTNEGKVDSVALSTLLGTIGSIASISQVIEGTTQSTDEKINAMNRSVYRY